MEGGEERMNFEGAS
jgi:hypothetical protein